MRPPRDHGVRVRRVPLRVRVAADEVGRGGRGAGSPSIVGKRTLADGGHMAAHDRADLNRGPCGSPESSWSATVLLAPVLKPRPGKGRMALRQRLNRKIAPSVRRVDHEFLRWATDGFISIDTSASWVRRTR